VQFLGIKTGQTVIDVIAAGGWKTGRFEVQ
jgi:predicted methyltransferase